MGGVKSYAWPEKVFLFQIPGLDRASMGSAWEAQVAGGRG